MCCSYESEANCRKRILEHLTDSSSGHPDTYPYDLIEKWVAEAAVSKTKDRGHWCPHDFPGAVNERTPKRARLVHATDVPNTSVVHGTEKKDDEAMETCNEPMDDYSCPVPPLLRTASVDQVICAGRSGCY